MNYDETREKIKSGDVLAWTHKPWKTWYDFKVQMVRVFTQSEYSHVGMAYELGGRLFVLESVSAGVRMFPLSKEVPFYWIPTKVVWTPKVEEFALAQFGEPYSQWLAVKAFFTDIGKSDTHVWECAKYVKALLYELGMDLPGHATPSDVVHDLQEWGLPVYIVNP